MFDLFGKTSFILVLIGLLSTGIARCSIDLENGAKFMRGVGGAMMGTSNPELNGQNCRNGICINQQTTDFNPYPRSVDPLPPRRN